MISTANLVSKGGKLAGHFVAGFSLYVRRTGPTKILHIIFRNSPRQIKRGLPERVVPLQQNPAMSIGWTATCGVMTFSASSASLSRFSGRSGKVKSLGLGPNRAHRQNAIFRANSANPANCFDLFGRGPIFEVRHESGARRCGKARRNAGRWDTAGIARRHVGGERYLPFLLVAWHQQFCQNPIRQFMSNRYRPPKCGKTLRIFAAGCGGVNHGTRLAPGWQNS